MFKRSISWGALCALTTATALAQSQPITVESLQASAKVLCRHRLGGHLHAPVRTDDLRRQPHPADASIPRIYPTGDLPTPPGGTPPRENWYSPPAQIGDNLYFLGTRNHNTYALVSKDGEIILIDGNFEYATEAEIHEGLKALGLDPNNVRYSIYAHAHGDHDGGAHLTEAAIPGVTIVYGDRRLAERAGPHRPACDPLRAAERRHGRPRHHRRRRVGADRHHARPHAGHAFVPVRVQGQWRADSSGLPWRHRDLVHRHCRLLRRIHRLGQEVRAGGSGVSAPPR